MTLLQFVIASRRLKDPEALFVLFIDAMRVLGYDRINFSIISANNIPLEHQGFGKINTYPFAWQHYYVRNNCRQIDPVALCATSMFRPFHWSELERLMELTKRQIRFLKDAEAAGLHNGIGVPFKGPKWQVAGVALATSQKDATDLPPLDYVVAFCNQMFEVYCSLVGEAPKPISTESPLSKRECQVLEFIGKGMTDAETGVLLGIQTSTVDSHLRSAFGKLKAKTRTGAAMTAQKMGLIDP